MGLVDTEVAGILREFVQFLESLSQVQLSPTLENVRENLLSRSKATLFNLTIGPASPPEPYLEMNVGKGIFLSAKSHNQIQDYMNTDRNLESRINQDYYETFQEINCSESKVDNNSLSIDEVREDSVDDALVTVYSNLSATQMRITCNKCGQLYRKGERKIIPFIESIRTCWVGLVGSHLLIYGSEKDSRPNSVISIRGYRGRPAPSIDTKRSESAFEIFCPGHKTLQFVAKTPDDMEEWVAMICEMSSRENDNRTRLRDSLNTESLEMENKLLKNSESSSKDENKNQEQESRLSKSRENFFCVHSSSTSPVPDLDRDMRNELLKDKLSRENNPSCVMPHLSVRISRRLPSLPHEEILPAFEPADEPYDEDDIYHKIEDIRDGTSYQNIMVVKKIEDERKEEKTTENERKHCYVETYDDVDEAINESCIEIIQPVFHEAYDDVQVIKSSILLQENQIKKEKCLDNSLESYDDIQTIVNDYKDSSQQLREEKLCGKALIRASRSSFLDKMKNRNFNTKKGKKIKKRNSSESLVTYDDISAVTGDESEKKEMEIEEQSEYLCPPVPRPIYSVPPRISSCCSVVEQFYDDIDSCQDDLIGGSVNVKSENCNQILANQRTSELGLPSMKYDLNSERNFQLKFNGIDGNPEMEFEHYQTPRSDRVLGVEEVLYDDVALSKKIRARPKELAVSNFEKVWNRFSGGKSKTPTNGNEKHNEFSSSHDDQEVRINRFQKLVNKIENSLSKSSVRPLPLSNTKLNSSSNVS